MAKQLFEKILPRPEVIKEHKSLAAISHRLHEHNLWHLNRRSVAGGVALGVAMAFIPIPLQMLCSAILAIYLNVNLPLAVAAVWITNPVTIPIFTIACYKTGATLLGMPEQPLVFEFDVGTMAKQLESVIVPVLAGCVVIGSIASGLSYALVRWFWRISVIRRWNRRKLARAARKKSPE